MKTSTCSSQKHDDGFTYDRRYPPLPQTAGAADATGPCRVAEKLPSKMSLFFLWHTSGIAATATINTLTIARAAAAENVIIRAGVLRGDDGQVRYV
jgi:hypothetical protein